ncbi:MAG: hypothetical protein SF066_22410 [Thermoanaerobaculia bacterium]|nr:hypothetical protein [Thermoanaerobaculia bacterium]
MTPLSWIAAGLAATLSAAPPPSPPTAGWVELPLGQYHELVERAQRPLPQPPVADSRVFAERLTLRFEGDSVRVEAEWDLDFSGPRPPSLALDAAAVPDRLTVTPPEAATVGRDEAGTLQVTPLRPGRVTVRAEGVARLAGESGGSSRLPLPVAQGSVVELTLELPAGLDWSLPGSYLAGDELRGERRTVRLTRRTGSQAELEVRGRVAAIEPSSAYVRGVAVTLIAPGPDQLERTDVVLYDVQRGFLAELALRLPAGFEPDPTVTTDEGSSGFELDGERLVVTRQNRLAGRGHLVLASRTPWPTGGTALALPVLEPEVEVRSRFLVVTATLAAEWQPQPAGAWSRVDREDLPPALREAVEGLALAAVWRLAPGVPPSGLALGIEALPAVPLATGLLPARTTVTVATVEGSLVHRDEIVVESGPPALEVELPPGVEFWSAQVSGAAVRPIEANGVLRFPLPPGRGQRHRVEIVSAEKRVLPAGKSKENLRLQLPMIRGSVLRHEWRLMLPENRDYRLVDGELRAVPPPPPPPPPAPMGREEPLLGERKIRTGSTVSQVELEEIPTVRDPWVILQNVPGVQLDRINVGGNESGQQSNFLGPLPVEAKVPETGKAVLLSGALPPSVVTVTIESRPLKKGRRP